MKTGQISSKAIMVFAIIISCMCFRANGQVPLSGKYNTTDYPEDRKAIEAQRSIMEDSTQFLNDDYIGVGAEGKAYYGYKEEIKSFFDNGMKFKSVTPVPGSYVLRIYNGDAAIRNSMLDVVFEAPKGTLSIRVLRIENDIKQNGKWYFVAGQGTLAMSKEEFEKATAQFLKTK